MTKLNKSTISPKSPKLRASYINFILDLLIATGFILTAVLVLELLSIYLTKLIIGAEL